MSVPTSCPKCGPRQESDLDVVPFQAAYIAQLKDWRTWAFALGVTVVVGMISGGLGLHTSAVGAGAGVVIAMYMMSRVQSTRRCRACDAILRG
jgi:hypothetical protein